MVRGVGVAVPSILSHLLVVEVLVADTIIVVEVLYSNLNEQVFVNCCILCISVFHI